MPAARLYLASTSPRRRELIHRLGLPVSVGSAPVDEEALEAAYAGPPEGLAEHLASAKALAAARALASEPDAPPVVLGADTTVLLDGRILGKPRDGGEAVRMLRALRGRAHTVVTGAALARLPDSDNSEAPLRSLHVATRVHMRDYSDDEIARYVASGDPLDKAGSYGVQHPDFQPVDRVEGCYLAVVGLPLCAVASLLAAAGTAVQRPSPNPANPCPWSDRCRPPLPYAR